MAQNKTVPTRVSPAAFIKGVTGGQHGKGCLYLKTLDDVDRDALRTLVEHSAPRCASGIRAATSERLLQPQLPMID